MIKQIMHFKWSTSFTVYSVLSAGTHHVVSNSYPLERKPLLRWYASILDNRAHRAVLTFLLIKGPASLLTQVGNVASHLPFDLWLTGWLYLSRRHWDCPFVLVENEANRERSRNTGSPKNISFLYFLVFPNTICYISVLTKVCKHNQ